MQLPTQAFTEQPWKIHGIAPDFALMDVWQLPTPGAVDDFPRLVHILVTMDDEHVSTRASRVLFAIRWKIGAILGWDDPARQSREPVASIANRLPADLRAISVDPGDIDDDFTSVYMTADEWVAELTNRTVHALLHLGWVQDGDGCYRGRLSVLVKPQGRLGRVYLRAIDPFRHRLVYPPMMRAIGRRWDAGQGSPRASLR